MKKVKALPIRDISRWFRFKVVIALFLDGIDFFLAPIPVLNTLWDGFTFAVLYVMLKHRSWAKYSLVELVFPGVPGLSAIDMFTPVATIIVVADELIK